MFSMLAFVSLSGLASAARLVHGEERIEEIYPVNNSFQQRDGGSQHEHHHHPPGPSSSYAEPDQTYNAPAPSYTAPAYSAPAPAYGGASAAAASYSAPAPAYGAGEPSYSAPTSGYGAEEGGGLDLTTILIPVLALLGLSLLFPTYVSLSNVRKRRSIVDDDDAATEVSGNSIVSRIQDIYSSVVQSEECMERVACEVGGIASDTGISKDLLSAAEPFVSRKYSKLMKRFQVGKDCHKIKCGNLF